MSFKEETDGENNIQDIGVSQTGRGLKLSELEATIKMWFNHKVIMSTKTNLFFSAQQQQIMFLKQCWRTWLA